MRSSRDKHRDSAFNARPIVAFLALCLACHGGGIKGEYKSSQGGVLNFKSNGKVEVTPAATFGIQGPTQEWDYTFEDGKVILAMPGEPRLVIPVDKNGCLNFNSGFDSTKMCKAGSEPAT
jgi:hypothetical protein